ncbi:hypothetical protein ACFWP7_31650 [Streptomyces sp. NPDC058470]|uniref:hypothetical protein n=1 Tax=Streptomyces sp. NPDC058470 TaxID=3346515 RepID=UPI003659E227
MATVEAARHDAYTWSDGSFSRRKPQLPLQEGAMTETQHTRRGHCVADAHGRTIDLTAIAPTPIHDCPCTRSAVQRRPRARPRVATVVIVTVVLTGGLVVAVLLVVIRDIVTTVAGTSVTGLILKALLTPSSKRDR